MRFFLIVMMLLMSTAGAFARDEAGNLSMPDAQVRAVLKTQFDRPDSPLHVAVVAAHGGHSLASWRQDKWGGRALLRKNAGQWQVVLCGGAELKNIDALEKAGVPSGSALIISKKLSKLESRLDANQRLQFDSFQPGRAAHDSHDAHHH